VFHSSLFGSLSPSTEILLFYQSDGVCVRVRWINVRWINPDWFIVRERRRRRFDEPTRLHQYRRTLGDDTKAPARPSHFFNTCIKIKTNKIWRKTIFNMVRSMTLILLGDCTMHGSMWLWNGEMSSCQFSRWQVSAILDFSRSIMAYLKSPCTISYRSSRHHSSSFWESRVFCILATERQTNRWTAPMQ